MLGHSLARLGGVVLLVLLGLLGVIFVVNRQWLALAIAAVLWLGCLRWVVRMDRQTKRLRHVSDEQNRRLGAPFQGFELNVGLRWVRFGLSASLVVALALFSGIHCWSLASRGEWITVVWMAALGILMALATFSLSMPGLRSLAGHWALQVGPQGVDNGILPSVPWKWVHGVDLQKVEVKGQTQFTLMLALDAAYFQSLSWPLWRRLVFWPYGRVNAKDQTVSLPLGLLNVSPHLLLEAVRVCADRAAAPRLKDWHYMDSVVLALKRERARIEMVDAQAEADRVLKQLQRRGRSDVEDAEEVARMQALAASAFERVQAAVVRHSNANLADLDAKVGKLRRLNWQMTLVLGLGLCLLMWQVVSALMR